MQGVVEARCLRMTQSTRARERKVVSWIPHLQQSSSRSSLRPRLPCHSGWAKWQHSRTCSHLCAPASGRFVWRRGSPHGCAHGCSGRTCQKSCLPPAGSGHREASTFACPRSGLHASRKRDDTDPLQLPCCSRNADRPRVAHHPNHPLYPQERRPEHDGSLQILYAARIGHCRSCSLRAQCQESRDTIKKRLTRSERAHWRLSWAERLARNARPSDAPRLVVTLHGLPATFAASLGFDL